MNEPSPQQMWIESEAGGRVHYPSPRQAAEIASGLGGASGQGVVMVVGQNAVVATVGRDGRFVLEYVEDGPAPPYQALSVSLDVVVNAFERFAAGDESRDPGVRWSRIETRFLPSVASGAQRLPEAFYEIAPRLRRGDRPLDLRNEIVAEAGLSKLAAAKRVEEVQKLLQSARAAVSGGLLFSGWLVFNVVTNGWAWVYLLRVVLALGPFGYAWYIFHESSPRRLR